MIKKYLATKDTVITDAFKPGFLQGRATGSNLGESDTLEVFALYGSHPTASAATVEKSRILLQFNTADIITDRAAGDVPASGSVSFYLRMGSVAHHETLPKGMVLTIAGIGQSWDEGYGKDLDNYSDAGIGTTTVGGTAQGQGTNWINARSASAGPVAWTQEGGDYLTGSEPFFTYPIAEGPEDIDLDISPLVESWIAATITNNGLGVFVTSSQETQSTSSVSYYTKKFSGRSSEYWFNRPYVEARWDDSTKDQRNTFLPSGSNLSAADNLNTVYFYNYVRGQLTNIPGTTDNLLYVRTYESASIGSEITTTPSSPITGGLVETGIYSASIAVATSASVLYDRWYTAVSGTTAAHTGTLCISPTFYPSNTNTRDEYEIVMSNLRSEYHPKDYPRFRVHTRVRNVRPNIYSVATAVPVVTIVEDMYWQIRRISDDDEVVPFGTGSLNETRLSYDISGSYFDFDMSVLEPGYLYQFEYAIKQNSRIVKHHNTFKFKIDDDI